MAFSWQLRILIDRILGGSESDHVWPFCIILFSQGKMPNGDSRLWLSILHFVNTTCITSSFIKHIFPFFFVRLQSNFTTRTLTTFVGPNVLGYNNITMCWQSRKKATFVEKYVWPNYNLLQHLSTKSVNLIVPLRRLATQFLLKCWKIRKEETFVGWNINARNF